MNYDAQKVTYQEVAIFDRPALFTECRIDRATMPEGVYRYELRHGDEDWGEPRELARNLMVNFYGTVLTREPFQLPIDGWIPLESGSLSFQDGGCRTLAEFQEKYPASDKDVIDFYSVNEPALHALYFSRSEEQDKSAGCVGHLRGDFGSGKQFYTTWWPHQADGLNTPVEMSRNGAVGKHPKSEKHGNTAQFSEVERSGTQENCGGIGSGCRLRLRPLPVLHRRQSQRVARIDPNAVVVDKNIAENDRFDLFSR